MKSRQRPAALPRPKRGAENAAMTTLVFMIRGINVGGNRPLKMARLRALCEALGLQNVRTYLQSGNVVADSPNGDPAAHGLALEQRILRDCGYEVSVVVRTAAQMARVLSSNPLGVRAALEPKFHHATFLARPAALAALAGVTLPLGKGEEASLVGDVIYLYCPNGYGDTKINNNFFERKLGLAATTRNWQTVTALSGLCAPALAE
jgi:uncharacterized protein (DUF1697 family)